MKRLLYLLAASSALISSTPASAQDPVPSQPSIHSWSGFYGGVFGGYSFGNADVESDDLLVGDGERR